MRSVAWVTAAAAAVAATAGPAAAGPITWSWSADVAGETGKPRLDLGEHRVVDDPLGGSARTVYASTPTPRAWRGESMSGSTAYPIPIASVLATGFSVDPTPSADIDRRFRVLFNITDDRSGQTGTAEFFAQGNLQLYSYPGIGDEIFLETVPKGVRRQFCVGTGTSAGRGAGGPAGPSDECS